VRSGTRQLGLIFDFVVETEQVSHWIEAIPLSVQD
jgi:hypothetical protein